MPVEQLASPVAAGAGMMRAEQLASRVVRQEKMVGELLESPVEEKMAVDQLAAGMLVSPAAGMLVALVEELMAVGMLVSPAAGRQAAVVEEKLAAGQPM